jgi:hypothetical protein
MEWAGRKAMPEHTETVKAYDCTIRQIFEEKEDSVETGTDYEHLKVNYYLTQELKRNLV